MSGRIFYLESFLIKAERHFIEVSLAIHNLLQKSHIENFIFVGNKQLNTEVAKLLPGIVPGITQTVFENLEDYGESLFQDLKDLDSKYDFQPDDLLIIPTAYENQILGVTKFVNDKGGQVPEIAIQFHIILPPVKDSDDWMDKKFQEYWFNRIKQAFHQLPNSVSIWTTESENLNSDYGKLAGRKLGTLPVPFLVMESDKKINKDPKQTLVGFLGEGRQEKGLSLLLGAIKVINQKKNNFQFVIQNNNPRGYSEKDMKIFLSLMSEVKKFKNVTIIEGGIAPVPYHKLLLTLDAVIMPHNPANYIRRVSGLLIQGSMYNIPCIVSSGTEEQLSIERGDTKGQIFPYDVKSRENTVRNLVESLQYFAAHKMEILKEKLPSIEKLKRHNSALGYFERLLAAYPNSSILSEIVHKGKRHEK